MTPADHDPLHGPAEAPRQRDDELTELVRAGHDTAGRLRVSCVDAHGELTVTIDLPEGGGHLTYTDPREALKDACEFVTMALAAVRAIDTPEEHHLTEMRRLFEQRDRGPLGKPDQWPQADGSLSDAELADRLDMPLEVVHRGSRAIVAGEEKWVRRADRRWVRAAMPQPRPEPDET